MDTTKSIDSRLARMEARLVEGFAQLGVNVKERPNVGRITIDEKAGIVYIPSMDVPISEVLRYIQYNGYEYDVVCNGTTIITIYGEKRHDN